MDSLKARAQALSVQLKTYKDIIHRHPELSFEEHQTTAFVQEKLLSWGLALVDTGLETGATAVLEGGLPGRTVALRADIDAIAAQEDEGHAICSQTFGVMHGCGHDFHTVCLLGAAQLLAAQRETLCGRVVFIFQPAEEVTQGAAALLAKGLWARLPEKPACLFGLHNRPELPCGEIAVMPGPVMSGKVNFRITFTGISGHGGSPHKCIDPVVAGAALVNGVQAIVSRSTDPLDALVCAVYSIHTDAPDFFVPMSLTMTGSIRFHRREVGNTAAARLRTLTDGIAAAYGCTAETTLIPQVPVTYNTPAMTHLARIAAIKTVGEAGIVCPLPDMGSEDFAVFGSELPSFFCWLGSGYPGKTNAPWHHPAFETDDDALPIGAELLAQSALTALAAESID